MPVQTIKIGDCRSLIRLIVHGAILLTKNRTSAFWDQRKIKKIQTEQKLIELSDIIKPLRNSILCVRNAFPNNNNNQPNKINEKKNLGWLDESVVYEKPTNQTFHCQSSQLATAPGSLLLQKVTFYVSPPQMSNGVMERFKEKNKNTRASQDQSSKPPSTSDETAATAPVHTNPHRHLQQQLASEWLPQFPPSAVSSYFQALSPEEIRGTKRGQSQRCQEKNKQFLSSQKLITFLSAGN